jgi:hypothetical protein
MRLYRTTIVDNGEEKVSWQGTQADARAARKGDFENVETDEVDVPTSKPELLDWLNKNCTIRSGE